VRIFRGLTWFLPFLCPFGGQSEGNNCGQDQEEDADDREGDTGGVVGGEGRGSFHHICILFLKVLQDNAPQIFIFLTIVKYDPIN
jgi:hypothetical protein